MPDAATLLQKKRAIQQLLAPTSVTNLDPLLGTTVADRYKILKVLGEGGMGRVYLAEHARMGRRCAVKVMNPMLASSPDAVARFNREAANASQINHPNVAAVYDFGETDDGTLYIAMELVEGETLSALLHREHALTPVRAVQIIKQAADALAAAHELGIVHRDLKPDNIMLARQRDGSDVVKVVDFGIAKATTGSGGNGSQTVTTAGVSLGTPEYMSPEQLAGEKLDNRSDIYSLGLILFSVLTGELPFPRLTSKETLVRRLTSPPHTLAEVRPEVGWPLGLQRALDRALSPEPGERYEDVSEFGRDLMNAAGTPRRHLTPTVAVAVPVTEIPSGSDRVAGIVPQGSRLPYMLAGAILSAVAILGVVHAREGSRGDRETGAPVVAPLDDSAGFVSPRNSRGSRRPAPNRTAVQAGTPVSQNAFGDSSTASGVLAALRKADALIDSGEFARARTEYQNAATQIRQLREQTGRDRLPMRVEEALRTSLRDAVAACNAARPRGRTTGTTRLRCDEIIPRALSQRRGGRQQ